MSSPRHMSPETYCAIMAVRHQANPNRFEVRMAANLAERFGWTEAQTRSATRALDILEPRRDGRATDMIAVACKAAGETRTLDAKGNVR